MARLSKVVKFSICQPDLSETMATIGSRLAGMMVNQCLDLKLADSDPGKDGVQPDCQVFLQLPEPDPTDANRVIWNDGLTSLPACEEGAMAGVVRQDCWRLASDPVRCPTTGQWLEMLRTASEVATPTTLPPGARLHARCRVCADASSVGCG